MVRVTECREIGTNIYLKEIYGLQNDTKPTSNLATGSIFIEIDTGKVYFFDEENTRWIESGTNVTLE